MEKLTVKANQSLWSIASDKLGSGASNVDIQKAANQIADNNGLPRDAPLSRGQKLLIPDQWDFRRSADMRDALPRLQEGARRVGSGNAQSDHRAKPVLDFKAVFSPVTMERGAALTLPNLAGVKIDAHELVFTSVKSSSVHETALRSVDAQLGKLTQAQFNAVHAVLGGQSGVTFDAAKSYALKDFLPPALQALLHTDLETPDTITLPGTKKLGEDFGFDKSDLAIGLTMNCHATAWEAMRAYQGKNTNDVAVFYAEMVMMDGACGDAAKFAKVGELKGAQIDDLMKLDLRPGDVVQFHGDHAFISASTNLMHSAVYVGGGLFFEKPNTEGREKADPANYVTQDETPFRIATLQLMSTPINDASGGEYRVEVRRPKEALAAPLEVFGSSLQGDLEKWAKKKGRTLGMNLVSELEQGMGGNIRGEHASALTTVALKTNADGTTALDS